MDKRMIQFVRALRAAGVRISLAESQDALNGIEQVGVSEREQFRMALRAALIKEHRDQDKFDDYFPLFFSSNKPPLENINDQLTPEEQEMLQNALDALAGKMDALRDLLRQLMEGREFSDEELDQMGRQSGMQGADEMYQRPWFERRMNRQAGLAQLEKMLDDLLEQLEAMGMSEESRQQLEQMLRENMQGLSDQISQYVGANLAERMAEKDPEPRQDLLDVPLQRLGSGDMDNIRDEVRRLAARLRSRAALRQKRAKAGTFDPRKTMRQNMRYGGVPVEVKYRKRHKKPSLILICDLSTSMRNSVEFLLTMVYELADQVRRTHSFIFISDLVDISMDLNEHEPQLAVQKVMLENPPGYYSTDLGNSLNTFSNDYMELVDHRTTIIIFGDGRNNYNDPRLDIAADMRRKARRLIWFCPEPRTMWGTGDSDMWDYATHADGVYMVNSLRELASAVDSILVDN